MHASHEEHKTHTKITWGILREWEENKLFVMEHKTRFGFAWKIKFAKPNEQLKISQLVDLFEFLYRHYHGSREYQQTMAALHEALIFNDTAFLPIIMKVAEEDDRKTPYEKANTLGFILRKFTMFSESSIVRDLNVYKDALDLIIDFEKIIPRAEPIVDRINIICSLHFSEYPDQRTLSYVREKGFRHAFIFLFLASDANFYKKIYRSPYVIPLASCFNILQNLGNFKWQYNILNSRLLCNHPEKAQDLYVIFSAIYANTLLVSQLHTEAVYQKIMHPAVLNNLKLLKEVTQNPISDMHTDFKISSYGLDGKKYREWCDKVDNLLDGIIAYDLLYQLYPLLLVHLPKDMIREIFSCFLLLTKTVPVKDFVPRIKYMEKRILFPLTDSMVEVLDDEDLHDIIKQDFSSFYRNQLQIFNKLSASGMRLFLNKLGKDFVQKNLFGLNGELGYLLEQMSLDCQREFYSYLGADYIWLRMTDKNKLPHINLKGEQFALLMSLIDPLTYMTEHLAKYANTDQIYRFLGKVNLWNKALCEKAIEKLGKDWLLKSNDCVMDMTSHLNELDYDFQVSLIQQMGRVHIRKIIHSFEMIQYIFGLTSKNAQKILLELVGSPHFEKLRNRAQLVNPLGTVWEAFDIAKNTGHNILGMLHIDSQFLLNMFKKPLEIWNFHEDDAKFILHLECIGPVSKHWLEDSCIVDCLLLLMPQSYYATFIQHLTITDTVPSWNDWCDKNCRDRVALYQAMPESLFALNPMSLHELSKVNADVYLICLGKMSEESLKSIVNNAEFHRSVPRQNETDVCAHLLKKLGEEYLRSLCVHEDMYSWLCDRIPSLLVKDQVMNNTSSIQLSASRDTLFVYQNPASVSQERAQLYENGITR